MGTTAEWIRVLFMAVLFDVFTIFSDAITRGKSFARLSNLVATALCGLGVGMVWVFEWRVFHDRLAVAFAVVILALFAAGYLNRRDQGRANPA